MEGSRRSCTNWLVRVTWRLTTIPQVRRLFLFLSPKFSLFSFLLPAFAVFQSDILGCPQEDVIEAFVEQLGAVRISKLISEHYRTVGEADSTSKRAQELKRTVAERTFLFLSERRQQYGKGELKHDPEWIQKNLQVYEVRFVSFSHLILSRVLLTAFLADLSSSSALSTVHKV